jgi:hypothetical protein
MANSCDQFGAPLLVHHWQVGCTDQRAETIGGCQETCCQVWSTESSSRDPGQHSSH